MTDQVWESRKSSIHTFSCSSLLSAVVKLWLNKWWYVAGKTKQQPLCLPQLDVARKLFSMTTELGTINILSNLSTSFLCYHSSSVIPFLSLPPSVPFSLSFFLLPFLPQSQSLPLSSSLPPSFSLGLIMPTTVPGAKEVVNKWLLNECINQGFVCLFTKGYHYSQEDYILEDRSMCRHFTGTVFLKL